MEQIRNILNQVGCTRENVLGTGTHGCPFSFKKTGSLWALPSGTTLDPTRFANLEYIQELQALGSLIVLEGVDDATWDEPTDNLDPSEDGREQLASRGYYKLNSTFRNGLYFHTALNSLSGYGLFDFILVDKDRNILGTKSDNGSIKGLTAGLHQVMPLQFGSSTVGQKEGYSIQFIERSEIDKDYTIIHNSQFTGFNPLRVGGINQIELSFVNEPAAGDTSVTVRAVRKQDGGTFTGVDHQSFRMFANGALSNPTGGNDNTTSGTFVLTVPALVADQNLSISLYNNTQSRPGVLVDSRVYQSNALTAVVA